MYSIDNSWKINTLLNIHSVILIPLFVMMLIYCKYKGFVDKAN